MLVMNRMLSKWEVNFDPESMKSGESQKVQKVIAEIQKLLPKEETEIAVDQCLLEEDMLLQFNLWFM